MITLNTKLRLSLLTLVIAAVTSLPLRADDTEIYLGDIDFSTEIRPNVLFIIDTSGSMDTDVTSTKPDYDSTQTYTGSCNASYIYWDTGGNPPSCSGRNATDNWFQATSNVCQASKASLSTGSGLYIAKYARYTTSGSDRWTSLSDNDHTSIVECRDDWGVHGNGTNNKFYPADQNAGGPFRSNATGAINWNNTGSSGTLYSGNYLNYLNWISSGAYIKTRLETVQSVFNQIMDSTSGINAGLMRFDDREGHSGADNKGGYFIYPMTQVDTSTRAAIKAAANSLTPGGYTPLAETMYEAARYFRGEGVKFGNSTSPGHNTPGVLLPGNTSKYKSPVEYQCQQNFIVLLTDGDPTVDSDADNVIQALPGLTTLAGTCDFKKDDDCLDELSQYLYEQDQRSDIDGDQVVSSYMIGFTSDQQLLGDAARKGGGTYYTADDTSGLTNAFTQIISEILAVNTTFVAPAVPVNAFNRLTNRDELYFALFRPNRTPEWAGNIKRYQLGETPPEIVDANGNPAVDASTGFFSTLATSIWTQGADAPDGDDVAKGGAASRQTLPRKLYTYTNAAAPDNVSLITSANKFDESNALLTKTLLGNAGMTDAYRTELVQWARGVDVFDDNQDGSTTDARHHMGDPLHSNPVVVNYGGTDANPDIALFVATNEGMLHALNTRDGTEYFAFIPQELLPNLDILYTNSASTNHPYGLDGPITVWANDVNNNGVLQTAGGTTESGEFAYLYVGMRRGGRNYYALDVTNRSAPVLKWMIRGGQGDFSELAQTWSRPQVAQIKSSNSPRTVLLFGGGYDTNQDTETAGVDTQGRAVYMVDASTGARLWWAGGTGSGANLVSADMEYSIPATVVSGDINADGYTDIIFAVDVGGQVWRFDLDNSGNDTVVKGGVIAELAGNGADEHRRFYEEPDVSLVVRNGQVNFAIGLGSGYRAHPLSTVTQDRYYMLFTGDVYTPPTTYPTPLTETDLQDVTADLNPDLSSKSGWYINLEAGEKVLARSKTIDGLVLFTTFKPNTGNADSCAPSQGLGRLYAVSVHDARPKHNLDGIGTLNNLTLDDRRYNLVRGGIQPEPTLVFTNDDHPVLIVGTEKVKDIELYNPVKRTSWKDE